MSTNTFTDEEVEIILEALKSKPHYLTASEKDKLTIQVEIARKLTSKLETGRRSALQVRYKLLQLQRGYHKLKEKPKNYSTVNKQSVKYFKLLETIFGRKNAKKEMKTKGENVRRASIAAVEDCTIEVGALNKQEPQAKMTEFADYSFKVPQTTDSNSSMANDVELELVENTEATASDTDETSEFQKARQRFTTELQASQRLLVEAIKEQDKKYVRSFKDHCKNQEAVLERDRYEIKTILRNDRNEMLKIFNSVLNAVGKSIVCQDETDDSGDDSGSCKHSSGSEAANCVQMEEDNN